MAQSPLTLWPPHVVQLLLSHLPGLSGLSVKGQERGEQGFNKLANQSHFRQACLSKSSLACPSTKVEAGLLAIIDPSCSPLTVVLTTQQALLKVTSFLFTCLFCLLLLFFLLLGFDHRLVDGWFDFNAVVIYSGNGGSFLEETSAG